MKLKADIPRAPYDNAIRAVVQSSSFVIRTLAGLEQFCVLRAVPIQELVSTAVQDDFSSSVAITTICADISVLCQQTHSRTAFLEV
eukprot:SAG31_NODE_4954_length_2837_cov_1.697589_2_plen_86_part_00